jgi:hypothetical protein
MGYKRVPISRGMPRRGFEGGDLDLSSSRQMGHSYVFLGGSNYIKRLVSGDEVGVLGIGVITLSSLEWECIFWFA